MIHFLTPEEDLTLATAVLLAAVVFVEGTKGTLSTRASALLVALLLALALLAAVAASAHMGGW